MSRSNGNTAMIAVLFGMAFITAFNENSVNVALTYISAEFSVSSVSAQWLVTGYMIISAIVSAICAFLLHRFKIRRIVFFGAAMFLLGSVAAMFAPNFPILLVFRLTQAIGTGLFVPMMITTVLKVAPPERVGFLLAAGNMCMTFGPALGPVVTGVMISFFGWRTVFLPGTVIMLALLIAAIFVVKNVHEVTADKLDIPSVILASIGLTFFMYGLTQLILDTMVALITLAIGGVLLGFFARRQLRIESPMLNLAPLSNAKYVISCLMLAVAMMTSFTGTVLLPQYFQDAVSVTAFMTGMLILIPLIFHAFANVAGGYCIDRFGPMPLLPLGYLLMAAGMLGMSITGRMTTLEAVVVFSCVVYIAIGLVYSPTQVTGLTRLSEVEHAHGVSIMGVLNMVAAAFGTALYGGVAGAGYEGAVASGIMEQAAQGIGFANAMFLGAAFCLAAFLLSFAFRKKKRDS